MRVVLFLLIFLAAQTPWAIGLNRTSLLRDPEQLRKNLDALRPGRPPEIPSEIPHTEAASELTREVGDQSLEKIGQDGLRDDEQQARRRRETFIGMAVMNVLILFCAVSYFWIKRRRHWFESQNPRLKKKFGRPLLSISSWLLWSFVFSVSLAAIFVFSPARRGTLSPLVLFELISYLLMFGNITYFAYAVCRLSVYIVCCKIVKEPL